MATSPVTRILVRMYRIGTGDCLALKFFKGRSTKPSFRMLIDCGSCRGDGNHFRPFLEDLASWMGKHLDLLVVTHEHLDHVNGFAKGESLFDGFEIEHVWMAWTENAEDPDAIVVKDQLGMLLRASSLALERMEAIRADPGRRWPASQREAERAVDATRGHVVDGVRELLSFHAVPPANGLAAGESELTRSMKIVRQSLVPKTGADDPDFLHPGTFGPALPGAEGVRFYVLGPPKAPAALKVETVAGDVYERKQALGVADAFAAAVESLAGTSSAKVLPFGDEFVMEASEAAAVTEAAFRGENAWRDVSFDWLQAAGDLAMRLHSYTNNTSLSLAIEFAGSGRVLLFPGDSEIGAWRSWHADGMRWQVPEGDETKTVTAADLLARTVLYKVGHHSSHNGTARVSGLELMTHPDLHALITLDLARIGSGWEKTMPSPGLLRELISRTKGRVFRIDEGFLEDWAPSDDWDAVTSMSPAERRAFDAAHTVAPLFVELEFRG